MAAACTLHACHLHPPLFWHSTLATHAKYNQHGTMAALVHMHKFTYCVCHNAWAVCIGCKTGESERWGLLCRTVMGAAAACMSERTCPSAVTSASPLSSCPSTCESYKLCVCEPTALCIHAPVLLVLHKQSRSMPCCASLAKQNIC